jgi:hypothetical protein
MTRFADGQIKSAIMFMLKRQWRKDRTMKTCGDNCIPCCDYCLSKIPYMVEIKNKVVDGGTSGCSLHADKQHQDIAIGCGYCEDFHCFNAK